MTLKSYNDFIARAAAGYTSLEPIYGEHQAVTTASLIAGQTMQMQRVAWTAPVPNPLPSGVTAYLPVMASVMGSTNGAIHLFRQFNWGSIDLSTGTYTAGAGALPTQNVGGVSTALSGALLLECTTALNALPGNINITYTNQSGTSGQTTGAKALTASAVATTCGFIQLAANDLAVQNVTGAAQTGGTTPTGIIKIWGLLPLCSITMHNVNGSAARNFVLGAPFPPRLLAGEQIGIFAPLTSARALSGIIKYVGDN